MPPMIDPLATPELCILLERYLLKRDCIALAQVSRLYYQRWLHFIWESVQLPAPLPANTDRPSSTAYPPTHKTCPPEALLRHRDLVRHIDIMADGIRPGLLEGVRQCPNLLSLKFFDGTLGSDSTSQVLFGIPHPGDTNSNDKQQHKDNRYQDPLASLSILKEEELAAREGKRCITDTLQVLDLTLHNDSCTVTIALLGVIAHDYGCFSNVKELRLDVTQTQDSGPSISVDHLLMAFPGLEKLLLSGFTIADGTYIVLPGDYKHNLLHINIFNSTADHCNLYRLLGHLPKIQYLDLGASLRAQTRAQLNGTKGHLIEHLSRLCPSLTHFSSHGNLRIPRESWVKFFSSGMEKLTNLMLWRSQLGDDMICTLVNGCPNIKDVLLIWEQVTHRGVQTMLTTWTKLERLVLWNSTLSIELFGEAPKDEDEDEDEEGASRRSSLDQRAVYKPWACSSTLRFMYLNKLTALTQLDKATNKMITYTPRPIVEAAREQLQKCTSLRQLSLMGEALELRMILDIKDELDPNNTIYQGQLRQQEQRRERVFPNMKVLHLQQTAAEVDVNAARQIMDALPMLQSYKSVGNLSAEAVEYINGRRHGALD
ncbi:hypothetical protein BGZ74_006469 [Mortierella antarctica]|nr:hypothetical protein BGZ74_006469 [Mortierella antarctica]